MAGVRAGFPVSSPARPWHRPRWQRDDASARRGLARPPTARGVCAGWGNSPGRRCPARTAGVARPLGHRPHDLFNPTGFGVAQELQGEMDALWSGPAQGLGSKLAFELTLQVGQRR